MAKQSLLTNKKILWGSAGVLLTSGIVVGVLVPVLTSKDDAKEKDTKLTLSQAVLNAKSSDETISAMQKLYGLEIKKASAVNALERGELKTKYQSASNLATFIFTNKNSYQTLFFSGKEQTTNLQEVVLIMSPKNQVRKQGNTGEWPANQVNVQDQFNFLITFFKGKVVRIKKLNAKTAVVNAVKIFFRAKAYDLVNLFYDFKNADPQASDFGYYNAYLDDDNNTQGLALFKDYLLTLKEDSTVTFSDLTEVQFTKKSPNLENNTVIAELRFSYQGLSTTKTISDFEYREIYDLSLKAAVENKMADEVEREDIDTTNLPTGVSIINIEPSPDYPDGSVIKITFSGGTITSQNFPGLTSYQSKAQSLLQNAVNNDFTITGQSQILPSAYNDKVTLLNQLKAKANAITNNNAKTKVKEILGTANITFDANDQTGVLSFTIAIGTVNKTFAIGNFSTFINHINKRIDAEVARRTKPAIKPGSEWNTGSQVSIRDIIIIPSDNALISKIKNVVKKIDDSSENTPGSIVTVTIEVSSLIVNTKKVTYNVDIKGFTSVVDSSNYGQLLKQLQNSDFITIANKNILPSQFKNFKAIKTIIKEEIKKATSIIEKEKNLLKKAIDSNAVIIFQPDDDQGILNFNVLLGFTYNKKTFTVTGFKMST